jgi:hypothetical protein
MAKHFIAMAGLHGYLPSACEAAPTLAEAVGYLAAIHNLGKKRRKILKDDMYLELNFRPTNPIIEDDGNEYCEITECSCNDPSVHCDSGEYGWDG